MAKRAHADLVQELLSKGATLIEVLPQNEYLEQHIRGAIHISLKKLDAEAVSALSRKTPVIVYCWDSI